MENIRNYRGIRGRVSSISMEKIREVGELSNRIYFVGLL
jgi:hypothetical protein